MGAIHHRKTTRSLFEKYFHRYSPYGSFDYIYFWAVLADAIEGLKDYAPKKSPTDEKEYMRFLTMIIKGMQ